MGIFYQVVVDLGGEGVRVGIRIGGGFFSHVEMAVVGVRTGIDLNFSVFGDDVTRFIVPPRIEASCARPIGSKDLLELSFFCDPIGGKGLSVSPIVVQGVGIS